MRAANPSALTLDGTNTYVVAGWVVDPGPADDAHLDAVLAAANGSLEGIVLTHAHPDHAEGAPVLGSRAGVEVIAPSGGERVGPFEAVATPGHSPDHVSLLHGRVLFAGDVVLGEGSVFVGGDEGSMGAYLDSLRRLRELELDAICPGHGPVVWEPHAKLDEYLAHRLERERLVLEAVERARRRATRCWTGRGPTLTSRRRRSCGSRPASRWTRTWRSSWRRGGWPRGR